MSAIETSYSARPKDGRVVLRLPAFTEEGESSYCEHVLDVLPAAKLAEELASAVLEASDSLRKRGQLLQ